MDNCSCVYMCIDNHVEFHSVTIPKARKEHKCCECGRVIRSAEKYERVAGMWDGCFDTYKTCVDCLSVRGAFFCNGWYYSELYQWLREHIAEMDGIISSSCIVLLTSTARQKVCDMIQDYWANHDQD